MSKSRFRPFVPFDDIGAYEEHIDLLRRAELDEHVAALEREARAVKAKRRRRGFWWGAVMCVGMLAFLAVWAWLVNWLVPIPENPGVYGVRSTLSPPIPPEAPDLAYTSSGGI